MQQQAVTSHEGAEPSAPPGRKLGWREGISFLQAYVGYLEVRLKRPLLDDTLAQRTPKTVMTYTDVIRQRKLVRKSNSFDVDRKCSIQKF